MPRQPPPSPLFPYTTLFRSNLLRVAHGETHTASAAPPSAARHLHGNPDGQSPDESPVCGDRKSRLNSSHTVISYAVFCLKKKKIDKYPDILPQKSRAIRDAP